MIIICPYKPSYRETSPGCQARLEVGSPKGWWCESCNRSNDQGHASYCQKEQEILYWIGICPRCKVPIEVFGDGRAKALVYAEVSPKQYKKLPVFKRAMEKSEGEKP